MCEETMGAHAPAAPPDSPLMTYQQCLDYIHSLLRFGVKPGLSRTRKLCALLGDPQKKLRFVHVAGTNGKGSVCAMLSEILQCAGYRTGLYTSPYITDFCDRFQVNSVPIGQDALIRQVQAVKPHIEQIAMEGEQITEFEAVTAVAFNWFFESGCDVVVLETGLGGRFDATNVIESPLCAVITAIGLDHTAVLGDTYRQIAVEKCGIIKPGYPVVCYPKQEEEALEEIFRKAWEQGSTLYLSSLHAVEVDRMTVDGSDIRYGGLPLHIPLAGEHQHVNAVTAVDAIRVLSSVHGFSIPDEQIQKGISQVKWPARLEVLSRSPLILLDGAHNPQGIRALADTLEKTLPGRRAVAVMGMLSDKAYREVAEIIAPFLEKAFCVTPDHPRALDGGILAQTFRDYGVEAVEAGCRAAVAQAVKEAGKEGMILIFGSLSLAGPVRKILPECLSVLQK